MKFRLLALSIALLSLNGCAGLMEFHIPKEFEGQKVKEDPPGTMLPIPKPEFKTC